MMIGSALFLLAANVPPPPPPPADAWAAAVALWNEHPPAPMMKRFAIAQAVSTAASRAASAAFLKPNARRSNAAIKAFSLASLRLQSLLERQVPVDQAELDAKVARCATKGLAYSFSAADVEQLRGFAATEVGARFWRNYVSDDPNLVLCYQNALNLQASDADLRAVGIDPAKVDPRRR